MRSRGAEIQLRQPVPPSPSPLAEQLPAYPCFHSYSLYATNGELQCQIDSGLDDFKGLLQLKFCILFYPILSYPILTHHFYSILFQTSHDNSGAYITKPWMHIAMKE